MCFQLSASKFSVEPVLSIFYSDTCLYISSSLRYINLLSHTCQCIPRQCGVDADSDDFIGHCICELIVVASFDSSGVLV